MQQTIGKRIMEHRKRLGMTQDQLAERLGVTAQAVSKWENDQSCPDINTLPRLAEIFETTTDALLGRAPEGTVHEAEIVEDERNNNKNNGNWTITWNAGRNQAIGGAVLVLLIGVIYLLTQILSWNLNFWDILWSTSLLVFGCYGLYPRFSFPRIGCALFGGYFLVNRIFSLNFDLDGGIVIAIIFLLLGLSLLLDAIRKPAKPHFQFHKNKINPKNQKEKTTCEYSCDGKSFTFSASFGERKQYITLPQLQSGSVDTSFGDYTIDLRGVDAVCQDCTISLDHSFGELTLLVPKRFSVNLNSDTAFSGLEVHGEPDPVTEGTITVQIDVSFGQANICYI